MSIADYALLQFRQEVHYQTLERGAEAFYEKTQRAKNSIDRSVSTYLPDGQLEKVQLRVKRVDCDSSLNSTIAAFSGLLGGTIKCNNFGDIKPFIDNRLNKNLNKKVD